MKRTWETGLPLARQHQSYTFLTRYLTLQWGIGTSKSLELAIVALRNLAAALYIKGLPDLWEVQ